MWRWNPCFPLPFAVCHLAFYLRARHLPRETDRQLPVTHHYCRQDPSLTHLKVVLLIGTNQLSLTEGLLWLYAGLMIYVVISFRKVTPLKRGFKIQSPRDENHVCWHSAGIAKTDYKISSKNLPQPKYSILILHFSSKLFTKYYFVKVQMPLENTSAKGRFPKRSQLWIWTVLFLIQTPHWEHPLE